MKTDNTFAKLAVRHGEIVIWPVADDFTGCVEDVAGEEIVVAYSETGHHHVVTGDAVRFLPLTSGAEYERLCRSIWGGDESMREFWPAEITPLRVVKPSAIEHRKSFDQHETFALEPHNYVVIGKREYDPFADVLRKVRD